MNGQGRQAVESVFSTERNPRRGAAAHTHPAYSMLSHEKQTALAEATAASTARQPIVPAFLKVPAAVAYSGIGRSTLYELMGERKIKSHRIGVARVIDRASLEAFITSQPS
jgi:excisionase family DNA binding protein